MDDVACSSSYTKLIYCPSSILGTSNCGHSEDAGVSCQAPCTNGQIRLVGNTNVPQEGRVEYCLNNNWGTICHNSWGATDAQVACHQLGYLTEGAIAYSSAKFGSGTGPILYRNVACTGNELALSNCSKTSAGGYCSHSQDAGIRCLVNSTVNCTYGDVRLVGGSNQYEGRVEICINGIWGTVCDDYFSSTDATVVCKQLGYSYAGYGIAHSSAHFGAGSGKIWMDDVACSSSYNKLIYCPSSILGTSNCGHSEDAGVTCQAPCTNGQLRLVGGSVAYEGRVEVCMNNEWGTVCYDYWGTPDSSVVCKQLGYSENNSVAFTNNNFGSGVVSPLPSSSPTSYKSSSLTPSPSSSIHSSSSRLLISTTSETRTSTSITSSIVPSPTCPSTIASVSLQNTITLLLTNYSIATFTSSAQERFKQITAEIVHNYCTYFKQDCNPIKLTDTTKTDGSICVVITRIQSGGSTNKRATNDQTLVTFFVTLNDGAGLLPVTALTVSVEAGIRNGNYNIFSEVVIVSGSTSSSTTTPSATLSSSSSTGTTVGVTVGVVLLVMITIGVIVIVLVFMVLRGKRENQYNTGAEVFENLVTKGSNSINSGPVFRSVLEESEKKFSNPMYGHDDD
uniref:SRCR domain-containing protein n=1 Tax=Amphimedon queenslandica TaxID=400682 RepID=A0A1X7U101_AMPQE